MNITVAVALITALSTLSAALIASLISLRIQRQQVNAQRQLADDQRREQRKQQHAEIQRQTYVQFLNEFDKIELRLQDCWQEYAISDRRGPINPVFWSTINSITALYGNLNLLNMVAPVKVVILGHDLIVVALNEVRFIISFQAPGQKTYMFMAAGNSYSDAFFKRWKAKQELIIAMRSQVVP